MLAHCVFSMSVTCGILAIDFISSDGSILTRQICLREGSQRYRESECFLVGVHESATFISSH